MHVKARRTLNGARRKKEGRKKKGEAEGEFGRIDCVMVARGSADAIRVSACARRESASLRRLFICRNAERG